MALGSTDGQFACLVRELVFPPKTALLQLTGPRAYSDAPASSAMALPETLWLSPTSLAKVDNDLYRAFVIDKVHLPHPENQSGSKRPITLDMCRDRDMVSQVTDTAADGAAAAAYEDG